MRPDHQEIVAGLRLAAIAVGSAVLMATLIIGLGRAVMPEQQAAAAPRGDLIRIALR